MRGIGGLPAIANEEDTRPDCDGPGAVFWGPAFVSALAWYNVCSVFFRSVFFSPSVSYIVMDIVVIYFVYLFHKLIVLVNEYE